MTGEHVKHWSVLYHSEDIYGSVAELRVDERPAWAHFVGVVAEAIDGALGHKWCNPPDWAWHLSFKKPKDEDDFVTSVGSLLYDSFNRLMLLEDHYAHDAKRVTVTREWLRDNGLAEDFDALLAEKYDE